MYYSGVQRADSQKLAAGLAIVLIVGGVLMGLSLAVGLACGQASERREAINAGAAEWYLDGDGDKAFRYKGK